MERYYQILDLPLTATQEEIKTQYKQLVRMYHPDRFVATAEKTRAEAKLKEINEAYRYLTDWVVTAFPMRLAAAELNLVITPTMLDFGSLARNVRTSQRFQVRFNEGMAENADFVCSEENSWFKVVRVSHLYGAAYSALEFDVEVDTRNLQPHTYQGWVDVYLNGTLARVPLSLQVAPTRQWQRYAILTATSALAVAVLVLGVLALVRSNVLPHAQVSLPIVHAEQLQLPTQQLSFAVMEADELAVYLLTVGGVDGNEPKALGISGRSAVGSAATQEVAYLDNDYEVHLLGLASGEGQVLTRDGEVKSALSWSPDSKRLAYLVGSGETSRIGVYEMATGRIVYLPGEVTTGVSHYAWSPDGETLLFDLWQGQERRVYRIGVDGSGLQQLTHFDSWGGAWSADGRSLVVSSAEGLYRLDSQGRTLTQVSSVVGEAASWSVDGKWLAYLTAATDGQGQSLWVMEVATGEAQMMASESVSYRWSPVGAVLGYVTGRASGETPLLYLWTVTPGAQPQLVAEVNDPLFQWMR